MKQIARGHYTLAVPAAAAGAWPRRSHGVTLLELLVTVAVLAIIVAVGVPGLHNLVQNNRATGHANELVTALNFARSEAIRRGARVTICASANGTSCGGGDWSAGWVVLDQNDNLIRVWEAPSGNPALATSAASITFLPRGGRDSSAEATFNLALSGATVTRCIRVNPSGRPTVERQACTA